MKYPLSKSNYFLAILFIISFTANAQTENCSNPYDYIITQIGQDIDGGNSGDLYGHSVSISSDGNTIAIGASDEGIAPGYVGIFHYNGSSWNQLGNYINGEGEDDAFGYSVSLSGDGNIVAVGAPDNDGAGGNYSGQVRVYQNNDGSWVQLGEDIEDFSIDDSCGSSVSSSNNGHTIIIGCPGNNNNQGNARIYNWNGSDWVLLGLPIDGESDWDNSGRSVAISNDGNIVAISSYLNTGVNGYESGHVRVYNFDGNSWIQLGQDIDGEAANDWSGYSVSISSDGNTLAIGAPGNTGNGYDSGHVRVYNFDGNSWIQLGQDIDGEASGDHNGHSVSLSSDGSTVTIGAPSNNGTGIQSGHVRIYNYTENSWTQIGEDIDGEAGGDWAGLSVSLSSDGDRVVIGSPYNNENGELAGHVRVFDIQSPCSIEDPIHQIGDMAFGGIIFHIDESGQNGLVAAMQDIGEFEWGCEGMTISGADGTATGTGFQNTLDILAGCSETPIAASEALAYEIEGYTDWFLPSKDELFEMYNTIGNGGAQGNIGGFAETWYWSSSQVNEINAWRVNFADGGAFYPSKLNTFRVRPIRAITFSEGCTDEIAINYNELASTDDGSCILSTEFNGYDIFLQPFPRYEPIEWAPYGSSLENIFEDNLGSGNGKQNTEDIVDFYGTEESYAANYCYNLEQHGYSDWYLPSSDELGAFHSYLSSEWDLLDYYSNTEVASGNQIAEQTIGCCFSQPLTSPGIFYWTSNENYPLESATLKKIFENSEWHDNKSNTHPVRCVRNNAVEGCQDEAACNYNYDANLDDNSCAYPEEGFDCNGYALEACPYDMFVEYYSPALSYNTALCQTLIENGCTNTEAENYNPQANIDDGSCIIYGCTDLQAENYNSQATTDNESCIIYGCINYTAENYNPQATIEDGSCNIQGCTLEFFPNYNAVATVDDASCSFTSNNIYGCTDILYVEYAPEATIDNGTCTTLLIGGCMDTGSCNYNSEANNSDESCEYPQDGYDCEGNITAQIGDEFEGGYLFYLDETGQQGLVAAMEDLTEGASDPYEHGFNGYEWGCYGINVNGADGQFIGMGLQNTIDIVLENCLLGGYANIDYYEGVTAAEAAFNYEIESYDDWYLPSKDELIEMYNTIGNGGAQGNIGGFDNIWYWSSTEYNDEYAWGVNFNTGFISYTNQTGQVRPIRSITYTEGCTDNDNDGICNADEIIGCQDSEACNYNVDATDAGDCTLPTGCETCSGETDGTGTVVDNDSDGDGVCNADEIIGCQDSEACNYNVDATDVGDCTLPTGCETCSGETDGTGTVVDNDSDGDGICNADEIIGCQDFEACNYNVDATDAGDCTLPLGCDTCTDEPDGTGTIVDNDADNDGVCDSDEIMGCTILESINYNIDATEDDGSCIAIVAGCTDQAALNYNSEANTDDGSCEYCPEIEIVEAISDISCLGGTADISITVYPPGFYGYEWSTGQTSSTIFDITNGVYTIIVTDNNGCSNSKEITIESPSEISIEANVIDDDLGQCEGEILPTITGGAGDYTFQWYDNNNQTTQNATDLCAGSYLLEVTDENGCSASQSFQVGGGISWTYGITSSNHTLFIQEATIFNLYNSEISFGDYIGAFYMDESTGELKCGGYTIWQEEQVGIPMWGDDLSTEEKDGFYENDRIIIGVYNNSEGREYFGQSVYFDSFPNEEMFSTNGLSSLQEFNGMPSPAWNTENTGQNHVIMLTEFEPFIGEEPLVYGDFIGLFFTDDNGELRCGGKTIWTGENHTIAAWGDDSFTPEKDGFDDGEEFTWVVWKASQMETFNTYASYSSNTVNQGNFTTNGISVLLSLYINFNQTLSIPSGWSMISINVVLDNYDLEFVLNPIIEDLSIAKDYLGNAYLPEWNFNGIGDINNTEGYQIKLESAQILALNGEYIYPENYPLNIPSGWSIISYLRTQPALADLALSPIESNIAIAKNYLGEAYLPEWNYNGIGNMVPGEGYQIKLDEPDTLIYLANNMEYRMSSIPTAYNKTSWCEIPTTTDNNMTIVIPEHAWDKLPSTDAEILAYDELGKVIGCAKYTSPITVLTLWGNDEITPHKDGMYINEQTSFKVLEKDLIKDLKIKVWTEGSGFYQVNAINIASSIVTQSEGEQSDNLNNKSLVKIINLLGQEVNESTSEIGRLLFRVYDDGSVEKFIK